MIAVIGLGFVGLTTALGFSHKGFKVFGYDAAPERLACLQKKEVPFYEPQLKDVLNTQLGKNFVVTADLKVVMAQSKIVFFCVGTPPQADGRADLSDLKKAVVNALNLVSLGDYKTFVIKSTVPPGTVASEIEPLFKKNGWKVGHDIGLAINPEFLREGVAFADFVHPDRIVIGAFDKKSEKALKDIYTPFAAPVIQVSPNTAEYIKYLSNAMLATMISFSNEMSMAADAVGDVDTREAFRVLHLDRRWRGEPANMASYVYPGCGFGGSCLPKDVQAFTQALKGKGYEPRLLTEVLNTNMRIKDFVVKKIKSVAPPTEKIGILGLAFKPNSDDVRATASKDIIEFLLNQGYGHIIAYDPMAMANFQKMYNFPIHYAASLKELLSQVSVVVILTAWKEFSEHKAEFKNKKVLDFRYFLDHKET